MAILFWGNLCNALSEFHGISDDRDLLLPSLTQKPKLARLSTALVAPVRIALALVAFIGYEPRLLYNLGE